MDAERDPSPTAAQPAPSAAGCPTAGHAPLPPEDSAISHRQQAAEVGYVRLAYAVLRQAISDAAASGWTWRTEAVSPSAADVRSAREFLASPAAHWLAAQLGLSLPRILDHLDALAREAPAPDTWLSLRQAAQRLNCTPEYLRRLIHRGQIVARRGRGGRWLVPCRITGRHATRGGHQDEGAGRRG